MRPRVQSSPSTGPGPGPGRLPPVALAAALIGALTASPRPAAASWPTPAAGESASGDPELIITLDDGPNPATTEKILDTLAAHHASAVFFVVGWRLQRGDPGRIRTVLGRMLREGHVVANHSVNHLNLCGIAEDAVGPEIDDSERLIREAIAMPVRWFRTPYGAHCNRLEAQLGARSLGHFHWDIDPQEWKYGSGKGAAAYVINRLKRLDGRAVLLMHDTKVATVIALPMILDWIAAENAARRARGGRPIRIVGGAELAAEQAASIIEFGRLAWADVLDLLGSAKQVLP